MSNEVKWNCPSCGKADHYDGTFSTGFGYGKFNHTDPQGRGREVTNNENGGGHAVKCIGCGTTYIVRLESRVVALVAPVGAFIEQGVTHGAA